MSPWGYLLFTGWSTSMTILVKGGWPAALVLIEIVFGLAANRQGLRPLCRPRLWTLILGTVVLGTVLLGEPDASIGPLNISREGLVAGLEMAGRFLALTLAFSLGVGALSLSDFVAVFDRLGLRGLGFATALALNSLHTLQEMATVVLQTLYLRGGMRRPWVALRLFLVTTIANTLRHGDEMINAAAVRAFDPHTDQPVRLPLCRADFVLLGILAGCTSLLLALGTQ